MSRILILGASGHIGGALHRRIQESGWAQSGRAARGRGNGSEPLEHPRVDSRDPLALSRALQGYDCVVNCVAGDFDSIARGAECLAQVAQDSGCARIVHLSTMSVYGRLQGLASEESPLDPSIGWYARAKCAAEGHVRAYAQGGGTAVILRPGCVHGAGSELWVGRIARWLRAGRIGDLGVAGDGWSNLVHVDDVCAAVLAAVRLPLPARATAVFNLAAPDAPRWNDYLVDLAISVRAVPVRRTSPWRLKLDAQLAGPPLKIAEKVLDRFGVRHPWLPDPLPPSVLRLWQQDIRLNCAAAAKTLAMRWTDYETALRNSSDWFLGRYPPNSIAPN